MSCCGKMREQAGGPTPPTGNVVEGATAERAVLFRCMGAGVAAYGPITGRRYDFSGPGATVAVDERDAAALAMVPQLQPFHPR